ncbi:MAG TPA: bifunctional pyr operon transcriptional regulator/uracil phosphoribosyltransferase PyrR [Polyangia bacterium]|nr:bifunctional pyr operon transcriptional regulator/uracil phosphoribosyltransferase PyrR [Polyangia bacterium]
MTVRPAPEEKNLVEKSELLDATGVSRVVRRLAYEIVERNGQDLYVVGVRTGGAFLADRIVKVLASGGEHVPTLGAVDISLYRDDVFMGLPKPEIGPTDLPASIEGRTVVLVDDVLYTGRTIRAAMDVLADYGRPKAVQLAALVDRGRRELPIQPDFVGIRVQTTADQSVRVMLSERGEPDRVVLRQKVAP